MNSFFTSVRSMLSPKKSLPNESRNEENNELPERIPNEEAEGHRQSSRKKKFRSFTGKRSLKNKSSLRPSNTNLQDQSHSNSPAYEGKFLPRYGTLPSRTHPNLNSQGRPQTISKGHSMSPGTKMPCENGWDKIFQDPRYPSTVSGNSVVERPVFRETSVNLPQRSALRPEDSRRQTRYGKKPDILELLSKNSCYHGTMSREAADRLLQREAEDGCYLVRRSTQRHRRLVLSMYSEGLTYNFAIECTGDDRLQLERSNRAFESLDKLLSHYQRRAIIKGCYLSSPVVQEESSDDDHDIEISSRNLKVQKCIGSGKFGTVLLGEMTRYGRVALKTYVEPTYSGHERESLWSEINVMKRLRHPNVIRMLGISIDGSNVTMVLEYAKFGDARTYLLGLSHAEWVVETIVDIARQVAEGMAYLESVLVVHRDLAARNVLITAQFQAKIADFGLAVRLKAGEEEKEIQNWGMRPLRWMAPESILQGRFSSRSDVWSFGVLVWEMFYPESTPYMGITDNDLASDLTDGTRLKLPSSCPDELSHLAHCCWSIDPDRRPSFARIVRIFARRLVQNRKFYRY